MIQPLGGADTGTRAEIIKCYFCHKGLQLGQVVRASKHSGYKIHEDCHKGYIEHRTNELKSLGVDTTLEVIEF